MLQQVDTPHLYQYPRICSSQPHRIAADEPRGEVRRRRPFAGWILATADRAPDGLEGRELILGIRPSDLEDTAVWTGQDLPTITVLADVTEDLGSEVNVLFTVDAPPVEIDETLAAIEQDEGEIPLLAEAHRAVFCARVDPRPRVARNADPPSVDPRRFHFFDLETGQALTTEPLR
jgi:multiple sugar transport system ATP-binding protein